VVFQVESVSWWLWRILNIPAALSTTRSDKYRVELNMFLGSACCLAARLAGRLLAAWLLALIALLLGAWC
jgi:hypothetical protein